MIIMELSRNSDTSLTRQIYEQIRARVLNGDLRAGEKLPSSRELADHLNVSRIIIVEAYDLLIVEGFLESVAGSGTYVASGAFLEQNVVSGYSVPSSLFDANGRKTVLADFRSGVPALDLFPRKQWAVLAHRVAMEAPDSLLGYDYPEGRYELREAITGYLKKFRGVICHPEQILITSGSVQGLVLVAQVLLSARSTVITEDPANCDIRKIFTAAGGRVLPVAVDEYGIQTELLPRNIKPVFVQLTPSHQFPLGGSLPIQRRIELIQYARSLGCYIVEDDYDSEFRYEGPPVSSLQGLDPERVIYLGTFSKTLYPALRIGYMVLPLQLVEKFRNLKRLSDMHTNSFNQLTLALFIQGGYMQRHISKMRKAYRKRRDMLIKSLYNYFPNQVKIMGITTGLHLVAEFEDINFSDAIISQVQEAGINIYPLETHAMIKGNHNRKLIFGYGHLKEEKIEEGIKNLSEILSQFIPT